MNRDWQEENRQVVHLVEAMLGCITPNFRAVYLAVLPTKVRLQFLLEQESAEDREDIDDIVSEFLGFQLANIDADVTVSILHGQDLPKMDNVWRMVYARKERV